MALNQLFNHILKKLKSTKSASFSVGILNFNNLFYSFLVLLIIVVFTIISNLVSKKNEEEIKNLNSIVNSKEFLNVSNYFISIINSPYKEVDYLIKNNDSVEKILKQLNVSKEVLSYCGLETNKQHFDMSEFILNSFSDFQNNRSTKFVHLNN